MSLPPHTEIFSQQFEIFLILVKIALVFLFLLIAVAIVDISLGCGFFFFILLKLMYYSFKIFLVIWIVLFVWPTDIYRACFWFSALIFNSFVKAYQKLRTVEPSIWYSEHIQHGKLSIILCFLYKGPWLNHFLWCSQVSSCVQSVITEVGVQHCCQFTQSPAAIHKDPETGQVRKDGRLKWLEIHCCSTW